jgi:hypothetical protein
MLRIIAKEIFSTAIVEADFYDPATGFRVTEWQVG